MLRMQSSGEKAKLHKLYSEDSTADHSADQPEKAEHLKRLAKGLYETSHYLHYHNVEESAAGAGQ
jgi:hypothetical protein